MQRYEHAVYRPMVSNCQTTRTDSCAAARMPATQRANDIWKQAFKEYEEPAMDQAIREVLDEYVAWRLTEISSDEPCFIPFGKR